MYLMKNYGDRGRRVLAVEAVGITPSEIFIRKQNSIIVSLFIQNNS